MSIQAVAWALEQDIPGTAKLVLVSLANHADHTTGHCWPSGETIAREASASLRSVYRYVGALRRNGYVRVLNRRGKDGKHRANDYWLLFDRPAAIWDWLDGVTGDETQDAASEATDTAASGTSDESHEDEPSANLAHGESTAEPVDKPQPCASVAHGPSATVGARQESSLEPSGVEPSARAGARVPIGYRRGAIGEVEQNRQAEEARRKSAPVFVFEGTRAWEAWTTPRPGFNAHAKTLVSMHAIDGKLRRGWYFKTLFPPQSTGPPIQPLSDQDASDFVKT